MECLAGFRIKKITEIRPLDINVETINWCPLKCRFCCNRIFQRAREVMSIELFAKVCNDYYKMGGGVIGIGAMQSDFLADPLLMKRIKILKLYKKKFYIYSTTPLISLKKYKDEEVKEILSTFSLLQISVEGLTQSDYMEMAGVDAFDIFQEQINRVYNIIKNFRLKITIHLYFRTYNIQKMRRQQYYKKLTSMFKERVVRDSFFSWFGSIQQKDLPKGAILLHQDNRNKIDNCTNPYVSLAVMSDGRVVGCGCIDWNATVVVGNLRKQTIKEVWRGKKATSFRESFSNGKIPQICKECGLYTPVKLAFNDLKYLKYNLHGGLFYNIGE